MIGGPGAFFVVAKDFHSFAEAIRHKLVREISGVDPEQRTARAAAASAE